MRVVVNELIKPTLEDTYFKKGDKFPVLTKAVVNGKEQRRVFFSEHVSIIVDGTHAGQYVDNTRSVYDAHFSVCHNESVTLTFNQD